MLALPPTGSQTSTRDAPLARFSSFKLVVVADIEVERREESEVAVISGISVVVTVGREDELAGRTLETDSTRRLPLDTLDDGPEFRYPNPILEPAKASWKASHHRTLQWCPRTPEPEARALVRRYEVV